MRKNDKAGMKPWHTAAMCRDNMNHIPIPCSVCGKDEEWITVDGKVYCQDCFRAMDAEWERVKEIVRKEQIERNQK